LLVLAAPAALAQASPGRVVMRQNFMYKPHAFPVSGDGDFSVQGLHWHTWGGKKAVADGQAVEQERPSHVNYTYPVRVTLSHRTYCANIGRTVYLKVSAEILGSNPGVFGDRNAGQVWTCAGTWRLTAADASAMTLRCQTAGVPHFVESIRAQATSCVAARKLVREWARRIRAPHTTCLWVDGSYSPGVCRVGAWRCSSYHTVNGWNYPVVCEGPAGRRRVRFVNQD
jgi:hypothetical protein